MKFSHVLVLVCLGAAAASLYGARKSAPSGAGVPAEAAAFHGAAQVYRSLAVFFGNQALRAEKHYWKVIGNG